MSALVAAHMGNGQYLMGLLMIEKPLLRLRIIVPHQQLPSIDVKKKRDG
jgi:hypothetical protein